jgi:hypothetical protein
MRIMGQRQSWACGYQAGDVILEADRWRRADAPGGFAVQCYGI